MTTAPKDKILIFIYPKAAAAAPDQLLARCGEAFCRQLGDAAPARADFSRVERPARQKPSFPGAPGIHFSVSHAGDYWVCAFSPRPVGLDLERVRDYRPGIARRFFHPEEAAWLAGRSPGEFFDVWTAKESCVKFWGCGINGDFSRFSVVAGDSAGPSDPGKAADTGSRGLAGYAAPPPGSALAPCRYVHIPFREDYRLCLCLPAGPGERSGEAIAYEVLFF